MSSASEALLTTTCGPPSQSVDSATEVKNALQQSLTEEESTIESAPVGLDGALRNIDTDPSSDQVAILFLKAGLKVWYAYFRATTRNNSIGSLAAALPTSTLHRIATDISTTVPHHTVRDRIKRTFEVARRGKNRTDILQNIFKRLQLDLPLDVSDDSAELVRSVDVQYGRQSEASFSSTDACRIHQPPSKRVRSDYEQHGRHLISNNQPPLNLAVTQDLDGNIAEVDAVGQTESDRDGCLGDSTSKAPLLDSGLLGAWQEIVGDSGYFAWPRALHLPTVFPHDLCTSVVKNNGLACVVLSMQDPANCYMTLEISPTSVQLIANDLFGVRIRFLSQRRHIYFENGATVHGVGCLELRGANTAKIDNILGHCVGKAFRDSPRRLEEAFSGEQLSSAVSFAVGEQAESSGRLTITLELEQSFMICRRLSGNVN